MKDRPDAERATRGSHGLLGVTYDDFSPEQCEASGARPDWEEFLIQLGAWNENAGDCDEDGAISPTEQAITQSRQVIRRLRENDSPLPTKLIEDGDGGIVLSRRDGRTHEKLRVSSDGSIEHLLFEKSQLQSRHALHLETGVPIESGS